MDRRYFYPNRIKLSTLPREFDRVDPVIFVPGNAEALCYTKALTYRIRNVTRGTSIGEAIGCAESSAERRTGLLKHTRLDEGEGLWIVPCEAVHTLFMKFALDLIYLDRKKRVRGVRRAVVPWRFSMCFAAHSVIELPVGTIDRTGTQSGDELEIARV